MRARVLWRAGAIAIGVLGMLDPTMTTRRFARAELQLFATTPSRDSALLESVERRLGREFRVIRGEVGSADATILVGDRLPEAFTAVRGPVVAIIPPRPMAWLAIERLTAPPAVLRDERVTVTAVLHLVGLAGRRVELSLREGARVVARDSVRVSSTDERLAVSLPFVASRVGPARVQLTADASGGGRAEAAVLVDVQEGHHDILTFDLRPSWMATFVRRTLETDPRLVIGTRVVTSRGISSARGQAPASLLNADLLTRFAVVVVGSPGLLGDGEVRGLERFMRERGGRVVLLLDQVPGVPLTRLVGGGAWRHDSSGRVIDLLADSVLGRLRGADFLYPSRLPDGASVVASATGTRPVIWRLPVGEGEVLLVGALDAWQHRTAGASDFGHFWPTLVAGLAAAAPTSLEASLSRGIVGVHDSMELHITLADIARGQGSAAVVTAAIIDSAERRTLVRLWPGPGIGTLVGTLRPVGAGPARVEIRRGADSIAVPLLVEPVVATARAGEADLVADWVTGSGGVALPADNLAQLPDVVHGLIGAPPAPEPWHPMRSPWWILPFACLLATEWWLRRRAGDA